MYLSPTPKGPIVVLSMKVQRRLQRTSLQPTYAKMQRRSPLCDSSLEGELESMNATYDIEAESDEHEMSQLTRLTSSRAH